jgi:hypothetical protein
MTQHQLWFFNASPCLTAQQLVAANRQKVQPSVFAGALRALAMASGPAKAAIGLSRRPQ